MDIIADHDNVLIINGENSMAYRFMQIEMPFLFGGHTASLGKSCISFAIKIDTIGMNERQPSKVTINHDATASSTAKPRRVPSGCGKGIAARLVKTHKSPAKTRYLLNPAE
jgi:hypothetical protein